MKRNLIHSLFAFVGLLAACSSNPQSVTREQAAKREDDLIRVNRYLVKNDADLIRAYTKRRNWTMETTQTGLWYMIYEKGNGSPVEKGKQVTLNYKISLLDGTLCYSSETDHPKTFRVSQGGVESGLEEGVLLLHIGDKARFIMPPHLAHGLTGDQNKIPSRATIVYEVEITKQTP